MACQKFVNVNKSKMIGSHFHAPKRAFGEWAVQEAIRRACIPNHPRLNRQGASLRATRNHRQLANAAKTDAPPPARQLVFQQEL
jgi:hypothetical protein